MSTRTKTEERDKLLMTKTELMWAIILCQKKESETEYKQKKKTDFDLLNKIIFEPK